MNDVGVVIKKPNDMLVLAAGSLTCLGATVLRTLHKNIYIKSL